MLEYASSAKLAASLFGRLRGSTRLSDSLTTPADCDSNGSERLPRASGCKPPASGQGFASKSPKKASEQQRAAINRTQNMASQPDAVAAKLQKQLEYYFSDANLRRDAHLKGLAVPTTTRHCSSS